MTTILLAHDAFLAGEAKTAEAILRYGQDPVVAVIDRKAGPEASAEEVVGERGACVPVVPTLEDALAFDPDRLVIGVAPVGGRLPPAWREDVREALMAGVSVVSGLHEFLVDDEEMVAAAEHGGATIQDLRKPPAGKPIYTGEVLDLDATIVTTVATDCSSGKMTTAVELVRALRDRGTAAAFVATGQTGLAIGADAGAVVDAVPADFVAGWTEQLILQAHEATGAEVIVVEGQGSITHPAYAGVSLGLLHGSSPHACVLCHDAQRPHKTASFHRGRRFPVHDPAREWALIQELASAIREPTLAGVSLMHPSKDRDVLAEAFAPAPVVDVLHEEIIPLVQAVEALR
ncbi:MAG: DUF1611 domain-containing protein [Candidatus Thermoplasmatota archaeon]|nr:DUF1611 domain-containing protein [Candidatus Thermoplasmatota archaeon]